MDITPEWTLWAARWALLAAGIALQAVALRPLLPLLPISARSILSARSTRSVRPAQFTVSACVQTPCAQHPSPPRAAPKREHAVTLHARSAGPAPQHASPTVALPRKARSRSCGGLAPRAFLLSGAAMTGGFALLERDVLLLAAQCVLLPLLWRRMRQD